MYLPFYFSLSLYLILFQFYLLDFSRTLPPVTPSPTFVNGHLYRLFRQEFVAKYPHRLCSDAYSGFIMHDPHMVRRGRKREGEGGEGGRGRKGR